MNSIKNAIENANNIAVFCHYNSDGDAIGSSFAFSHIIRSMGKKVTLLLNEEIEDRLKFLAVEDFAVYDGKTEYSFDLAIAVDCGDLGRLGSRRALFEKAEKTINIDHHKTNNNFADINVVKPNYSATCEALYEIVKNEKMPMDSTSAMLLYAGIISDSGCFKYSSTRPETLRYAAELIEYDFDFSEVSRLLFDTNSKKYLKFKAYILGSIEYFENDKIAYIESDLKLLNQFEMEEKNASNLIDIPRSVEEVKIAIELKERSDEIRVSFRSNCDAEVDRIATYFGGGGHIRAAGAELKGFTMETAKIAVLEKAKEELIRVNEA